MSGAERAQGDWVLFWIVGVGAGGRRGLYRAEKNKSYQQGCCSPFLHPREGIKH